MVIKLLPSQVPRFWEAIKFASVNAEGVKEEDRRDYLNRLLHSLLNDKSQCFVELNNERNLLAVAITQLIVDKITGEKSLFVKVLYSWKSVDVSEWKDRFSIIKELAENEKCRHIFFESKNPKVWQLGESLGFKEVLRTFRLDLGGA